MTGIITLILSISGLTMSDIQEVKYTPTVVENTTGCILCIINELIK